MGQTPPNDLQQYLKFRSKIIEESNASLSDTAWIEICDACSSFLSRRTLERLRCQRKAEQLISALEKQNAIYVKSPFIAREVYVEDSNITALYAIVCRLSESTQSEFRGLCDRFDTSPPVQIVEETKNEIVEGVFVIGWDRIGHEFFEQLGLIQDEILYLNKQPDFRERIRIGLLIFEKKAKVANQNMLDNKLIDALKSAGLNRLARKIAESR